MYIFHPICFYTIPRQYIQNPEITPGKWILSVKIRRGIYIASSGSICVPQGSVLGLLHYILYTANLPTAADNTITTLAETLSS